MAKQPTRAQLQEEISSLRVYQLAWMLQGRERVVLASGSLRLVAVGLQSPSGGVCWFSNAKHSVWLVEDAMREFANAHDVHVREIGSKLRRAQQQAIEIRSRMKASRQEGLS